MTTRINCLVRLRMFWDEFQQIDLQTQRLFFLEAEQLWTACCAVPGDRESDWYRLQCRVRRQAGRRKLVVELWKHTQQRVGDFCLFEAYFSIKRISGSVDIVPWTV